MAVLNVVFCASIGHNEAPVALPLTDGEDIDLATASAANATAAPASTKFARLHAEGACRVAFGTAPTAGAEDFGMAAGQTEYIQVSPGDKIAAKLF